MTSMWSSDGGNLCLLVYFVLVFSTCSSKVEKMAPSFATSRNIGIKLCQVRCHEKGGCLSFEYNYETLTCRLSSDEAKNIKKREGFIVKSMDHSYVQTGPCATKTCSLNSRCLETRSGKAACVDVNYLQSEDASNARPGWLTAKVKSCIATATPLPPGCRDLYRASNKGNVEKVRRILSMGVVNVNCRVVSTTPLMTAARAGQTEVVEFLVSKGADVSLIDLHRNNSLHIACASGNVHTVMFVLSLNVVDIDAKNVFGRTAAMLARYRRHQRVVTLLESHGAR